MVVRESFQWRHWKLLTWRQRAGHVTPASQAGGPSPAAPQTIEASSAWGASSNRGHITSTPDLILSAPWRNMILIKVSVDLAIDVTLHLSPWGHCCWIAAWQYMSSVLSKDTWHVARRSWESFYRIWGICLMFPSKWLKVRSDTK